MIRRTFTVLLLLGAINAEASTPQVKQYSTYAALEKGRVVGVSISEGGEIKLAPAIKELFDTGEPLAWCLAANRQHDIIVGTGNSGRVFAVNQEGVSRLIFGANDPEVYAVATSPSGDLYVGTSPSGQIYRLSASGGPTKLMADLEDTYVWALLVDENGTLFAATGEQGNVYKIEKPGMVELLFESHEAHLRTMVWAPDGNLILGSSKNGYVFQLTPKGNAFALYDSPMEEIHSVAVTVDGTIFAAAIQRAKARIAAAEEKRPGVEMQSQEGEDQEVVLAPQIISPAGLVRAAESAIYRIDPNGAVKEIWRSDSDWAQCIALASSSELIVGTGEEGKVLSITLEGEVTMLASLGAAHVTSLLMALDGSILASTSNTGKVFRIGPEMEGSGTYESEVVDAITTARWGQIQWRVSPKGASGIALFTRSGNTEHPNDTWSSWSGPYLHQGGENIKSPPARFLQWKAEFHPTKSDKSLLLSNVSIAYIQNNFAPEITSITIYPPEHYYELPRVESGSQESGDKHWLDQRGIRRSRPLGKQELRRGFRSLSWLFSDANNDYLLFDLYFKRTDRKTWHILKKDFDNNYLSWDSQLMPDGEYQIRVVATDAPSNPLRQARSAEKLSKVFIIDNTPPQVEDLSFNRSENRIHFSVRDLWSRLQRVEQSVNANGWKDVYPVDGLIDSKRERFDIRLESLVSGDNEIVVRAIDEVGNVGFGTLVVKGE